MRQRHIGPHHNFRRQRGFNLIEVSIAVVIGVLVLIGVAFLIQKGFAGVSISNESSAISSVLANTKVLRSSGGYGSSGTNLLPQLRKTKGLPTSTWTDDGTTVTNSWGGAVTVTSTGAGYAVTVAAVPEEACIQLATALSDSLISTTINGTANPGKVDTATATTQCNSATANSLTFTAAN